MTSSSEHLLRILSATPTIEKVGRVAEAYGTVIRATGVQASVGEICQLRNPQNDWQLDAEVVGIEREHTLLTPLGRLEGISSQTQVVSTGRRQDIAAGDGLLGRVLDANAMPIDGLGAVREQARVPVYRPPPNAMDRPLIADVFGTGVRAVDTLLGMLARGSQSDVNVVALIGERGREVNEFLVDSLGEEGLKKSVVVVATSDRPPMERARAAYVATALAEHFRDQGKNVLFLMDSVTRYARALRDVGLSIGELPARRGYPPSVFSELPRLFERAGNDVQGSITAFYTVLIEEEDSGDPIEEEVRSILDGHIVLSRKLAAAAHYPAIDILRSTSRVMSRVANESHLAAAGRLRKLLAKHQEIELLLQIGEYKAGGDLDADAAIARIAAIRALLQQKSSELSTFEKSTSQLIETVA
jgi:ATP synthase in type III secretion protein N